MLLWPEKSSASFYWALAAAAAPPIMLVTSRQLAASFFTQLAGGDSYVAVWRLPVCGRAQHDLCLSAREHVVRCHVANRAVQSHVVIAIHILLDQAFRLPVTAAFPVECIRFSAICASAPAFRSIGDNRARYRMCVTTVRSFQ